MPLKYPNFGTALHDLDFTTNTLPGLGATITRPYIGISQLNNDTFVDATVNSPQWAGTKGLVLNPVTGNSVAPAISEANRLAGKILSGSIGANAKFFIDTTKQSSTGLTGVGVIRLVINSLGFGAANFNGRVQVLWPTAATPSEYTKVSFLVYPVTKNGLLLAQIGNDTDGPTTGLPYDDLTTIRIDLTHSSLPLNTWTRVHAKHPSVVFWPGTFTGQVDSGYAVNASLIFGLSAISSEVYVDRVSVIRGQWGGSSVAPYGTTDFPLCTPPETLLSTASHEFYQLPLTSVATNNIWWYWEGWLNVDCLLDGANGASRIVSLRSTGQTTQDYYESIGVHLGSLTQLNVGWNRGNSGSFILSGNIPLTLSSIPIAVGDGLQSYLVYSRVCAVKSSTVGYRLYINGFELNLPSTLDTVAALGFVTAGSPEILALGAGRKSTINYINNESMIVTRFALFNSIAYTLNEIREFSAITTPSGNY